MYAILRTGGKQYKVTEKETISVEKIDAQVGSLVEFQDVLMVSTDNGVKVGRPYVEGAKVIGRVVGQIRGPKIKGFTYKPKKHTSRRYGHRQSLTQVTIESISV
ncbi:MAG: 50S ribosomal protein L21 [Armatimonadota bacterium]